MPWGQLLNSIVQLTIYSRSYSGYDLRAQYRFKGLHESFEMIEVNRKAKMNDRTKVDGPSKALTPTWQSFA